MTSANRRVIHSVEFILFVLKQELEAAETEAITCLAALSKGLKP
jgi:hypothetical protein